jgi:integrase
MAIHKNDRGKWIAQVYDSEAKKMRHVGSFNTKREAQDAEATHRRRKFDSTVTVAEFAERWTVDYPRPAASTNKHNRERVKRFAAAFGTRQLARIDRRAARAWTLEHPSELSSLRAMFSDALKDDLISINPFYNLGLKQRKAKRDLKPDWLTAEDIQRLTASCELVHQPVTAQVMKCAILVSAYTGIRPGELFALERADVRETELVISKAVQSSSRTMGPPKNGKTRIIALPEIAAHAIEQTPQLHDSLVFTTPNGKQLYQPSWHWMWNPIRVAFGRPAMHYYELRHFCATYLLEQGLSPSDVAVQLGHTDGGVLVQTIYGHPSEAAARDRIRKAVNGPHTDLTQDSQDSL